MAHSNGDRSDLCVNADASDPSRERCVALSICRPTQKNGDTNSNKLLQSYQVKTDNQKSFASIPSQKEVYKHPSSLVPPDSI